jgi:DNA-directed RNA polymerase specialized sigma24 family protein
MSGSAETFQGYTLGRIPRMQPTWTLTEEAFRRLLAVLDDDHEKAAQAYERLRYRTIGLLQWWGAADAEDLADATFDRVARKLEEGASIGEGSIGAYVRGVARMIFFESRRRSQVDAADLPLLAPTARPESAVLTCFDSCLEALAPPDRDVVLRYYEDGKASDVRRRLAGDLGITSTALRIRAHRLREQLERCVAACTERL